MNELSEPAGQPNETNRRSFLKKAGATGIVAAGMGGVAAGQSGTDGADFKLGGKTSGWVGRSPSSIDGQTNPTLTLQAGQTYRITWKNIDGAYHDINIEDATGNKIVGTQLMNNQGETQTLEFTATTEMAEYYCSVHPTSMRGSITVQEGNTGTTPPDTTQPTPGSPDLEKFVQSVPIPETREPDGTRNGHDAYEISREQFTKKLHPDLPETTLWGFDGSYPGPLIKAQRGELVSVRFDNSGLPSEHLFNVDERIPGTTAENHPQYDKNVPVPEVRAVTHFHGLKIKHENDGQSMMWTSPEGVVGPGFVDEWQLLPMNQGRLTSTYHDHTLGIVRLNAYAGLMGMYEIQSQAEENLDLPTGEYDVPLLLQDKTFNNDGSLSYPDQFVPSFAGDTAVVNGAVWPYMEVEPRRYRLRLVNGANHRTFGLQLENQSGQDVPTMYQFAPGHDFLESAVPIGPSGEMNSLTIQPFERGEVIVDFSEHAGETFTLTNNAELPYTGENSGSDLSELMEIRVADPSTEPTDESAPPTNMEFPFRKRYSKDEVSVTREMTLGQTINQEKGLVKHTLNGDGFVEAVDGDGDGIVTPQLGATEIWEFTNETNGSHPMHMHLIKFLVIGRGPDGTQPPAPNERGYKDTVRVEPGETVRVLTRFEGYTGSFPWHCHMLEHEDYEMMLKFVVQGNDEGLPPVVGNASPADPDGDGDYEDVNGDGEVNRDDVTDLFNHFDDSAVQNHTDAYDFNENGRLDYNDIVTFFNSL